MAQIIIGSDGRCQCNCVDKCVAKEHNTGISLRCTEQELINAGHTIIKLLNKEDDLELGKYVCIDGKEKRLRIQCVYVDDIDSRRAAEEAIARSKNPKSKWKDN